MIIIFLFAGFVLIVIALIAGNAWRNDQKPTPVASRSPKIDRAIGPEN
jgi:hypothetical protein